MIRQDDAPIPWTSLTLAEAKKEVKYAIVEMLNDSGYTFDEIVNTKHHGKRLELRRRICFLSWFVLLPWMSEVEIAKFIGMKRTGFMHCRKEYCEDIKETAVRNSE